MDSINRKIASMPNIVASAKVWEINIKVSLDFIRQRDEPGKETIIMNIFQVLN